MPFSRGDVVLVPFPSADDDTYKQRPAIVVQSDSLVTEFSQRVMAQITSRTKIGASRVQIKVDSVEGKAMGLTSDSSLVMDKLMTLADGLVIKTIGKCPPQTMDVVDNALRKALDL